MYRFARLALFGFLTLALSAGASTAVADHNPDQHENMEIQFFSPNSKTNSDIAFWGDYAVQGYYRNDIPVGGFRIFDISNPATPIMLRDFPCDGLQADPILWDRNDNDIPDLLLLAVDRTMSGPQCGAPRATHHDDPTGWEGVRVFTLNDGELPTFDPIQQVAAVPTDCGAHTITAYPDLDNERLMVYVSSYPLRPGPNCGPKRGPAGPDKESPLHEQISVIEVPLDSPDASSVVAEPPISYPGDPDGIFDNCERGTNVCAPGVLNPLIGCHDIAVFVELQLAAAACAEQGQLWEIDSNGMPDTANPVWIADDEISGDDNPQAENVPGAVDFYHSATFSWDGQIVYFVDESFGDLCPPETVWASRPWHVGVTTQDTGRIFFHDAADGTFRSEFMIDRPMETEYCSAHMGLPVPGSEDDLMVNAWYLGGVDVIDFSDPDNPEEIAFYDMAPAGVTGSDNWSAYSYLGPQFDPADSEIPIYATDGVHNPNSARGFMVFRADIDEEVDGGTLDHLNPQTQEETIP
jgi:hypothetical protein